MTRPQLARLYSPAFDRNAMVKSKGPLKTEPLVLSASLPTSCCCWLSRMGCGCLSGIRDLTGMALAEAGLRSRCLLSRAAGRGWVVARGSDTKVLQRELLIISRLSSIDGSTETKQGMRAVRVVCRFRSLMCAIWCASRHIYLGKRTESHLDESSL